MIRPLRQALRMLLLPTRVGRDGHCGRALAGTFKNLGISASDIPTWIAIELEQWQDSETPSANLILIVRAVLTAGDPDHGNSLSREYFDIQSRLVHSNLMSHDQARVFLSHSLAIVDLARRERLSSAQIAKLLGARDRGTDFSRQSVAVVLSRLGLSPQLDLALVQKQVANDVQVELPTFADSDNVTAAKMVANEAAHLGFKPDMFELLMTLLPDDGTAEHTPYLQMLHYQCVIAEYYDHAATDLYEFAPRGRVALWLFEQYPHAGAGNPFLNNAKSVERIDSSWVRSKGSAKANALFRILNGLEEMGFAAMRELAKWLRLWLCRAIRLSLPYSGSIPTTVGQSSIVSLINALRSGNTGTFGILEQRIVDCIARVRHPAVDGWRERGLSDSVNTTNVSKRKLGDCDFQHSATRRIEAYESHGGVLTTTYIREHLRTLRKALLLRMEELLGIDEIGNWNLHLTFVAHSIRDNPPAAVEILGLPVRIDTVTFDDFLQHLPSSGVLVPAFAELVLHPLSLPRTPVEVRNRLVRILR